MRTFTNTYTHSYIHTHWPWRVVERKTKRECDTEETLGRRNMLWFYQPVERSLKARDDTDIEAMREWKQDGLKQTEEKGCESMGKSWKYIHTHIPGQTRNWSLQYPLTCKNTYNEHVHEHTLKDSLSAFMPNMDTHTVCKSISELCRVLCKWTQRPTRGILELANRSPQIYVINSCFRSESPPQRIPQD